MNAIDLLKAQHRQVERLFGETEGADGDDKRRCFLDLADSLAIHTTIEEQHFYPAVRARRTQEILLESVEEHIAIKRTLSDLLRTEISDESFGPKMRVLEEQVSQHFGEEEGDLFPKVEQIFTDDQLERLAQEMSATAAELADEEPASTLPEEIAEPPSLH
jgi:hemerythrin superfamily protein